MIRRATAFATLLALPAAAEEACPVEGGPWDLDAAAVAALYACMEGRMAEGYAAGGDPIAAAYRGWTAAATRPALAGPHGERFLQTFANDVAAEAYLRFREGDFAMPVGSVLAKESFAVRDGTARVGPLFVMEKVEGAAEHGGWSYSAVQPDGTPMGISQGFCHDCHGGFEARDSMGYPLEEVRVSAAP